MDRDRRRFLGTAAMTVAAAHLGAVGLLRSRSEPLAGLDRATRWLNSSPLTAAGLAGKVVVIDFCTYTCINWLRTLPYLRAWTQRYRDRFVLVGVHTPEFTFEKDFENVRRAVGQLKIDYPVAMDNDYAIWRAFDNQYWPALYVIDTRGRLRHQFFGERDYDGAEKTIQRLLAEAGHTGIDQGPVSVNGTGVEAAADWGNLRSPENYLGYGRTQNFASRGGTARDRRRLYAAPARLTLNDWALSGDWTMGREATALGGALGRVGCRFHARDVHLVMGPRRRDSRVRFRVSIDGQPPGPAHGVDVDATGNGIVIEQRLYQLIRQPGQIVDRTFEIEFMDSDVEVYAFTFG